MGFNTVNHLRKERVHHDEPYINNFQACGTPHILTGLDVVIVLKKSASQLKKVKILDWVSSVDCGRHCEGLNTSAHQIRSSHLGDMTKKLKCLTISRR